MFDSRNNINPRHWGPPGWIFLFSIADGYPEIAGPQDKIKMMEFLASLGHLLPCAKCRRSYTEFALMYAPANYVRGRTQVRGWLQAYKRYANENR